MKYYINKQLNTDFESAVKKVKETLPEFGFGVVTEFDIDQKLKEKLNVDFRKYKVIGACNPKYAYEALQTEALIGTMLPCNIVVQEIDKKTIEVAAIDPIASMQAVENESLNEAAAFIKNQLEEIISKL